MPTRLTKGSQNAIHSGQNHASMQRRDFLRSACQACAALALVPLAAGSLESCASGLAVTDGLLRVPKSSMGKDGTSVIKAKGAPHPVMVVQRPDGTYTALALNCPHKNGPVKNKGGVLTCDWHGSTFDREGQVTKGPSKAGLKRYPVEAVGEELMVRFA